MKLSLPKDVLDSLAAPDAQGIVRATVGLKLSPDGGDVELVEIDDNPLPSTEAEENDDAMPMPAESLPDLSGMPTSA